MGLLSRFNRSSSDDVEIVATGSGLIVEGQPEAVTRFVERIQQVCDSSSSRVRRLVADGLQIASNVAAIQQTHREYVELSPRAYELLKAHGTVPTGDGYFRSFVKADNKFAGNLDWRPVDLTPERALAMQTAALQLALRAAIRDVVVAIERVEGKVDKLVALARAERLGSALGDHHTLARLAQHAREHGRIGSAEWSTVSGMGAQIARDIETVRSYIRRELADVKAVPVLRRRSSELQELSDDLVAESLGLLVLAEENYVLWHEIKLAFVASHEPQHLDQVLSHARQQLDSLRDEDQALLDAIAGSAGELLSATGYEGFTPLERRRLRHRGAEAGQLIDWFADQRHLDSAELAVQFPSLMESAGAVRNVVETGSRAAGRAIESGYRRIRPPRERESGDGPLEGTDL